MYDAVNHRLGIGNTYNPGFTLEITNSGSDTPMKINGTNTSGTMLVLYRADSNPSNIIFQNNSQDYWQLGNNTENSFDLYDKVASRSVFSVASSGNLSLMPTSGNVGIGTSSPNSIGKFVVQGGQAGTATSSSALMTPGSVQGERANLAFYSTFVGTTDYAPRRTADIVAGFNSGSWGTEYITFNVGYNGDAANDLKYLTTERVRIDRFGKLTATGDIVAFSDQRLKTNLRPLEDPVLKIKGLAQAVSRYQRIDLDPSREHVGFLAQRVQEFLPEAVFNSHTSSHGVDDVLSLNDRPIIATLVAALNQALSTIDDLNERVATLEHILSRKDLES